MGTNGSIHFNHLIMAPDLNPMKRTWICRKTTEMSLMSFILCHFERGPMKCSCYNMANILCDWSPECWWHNNCIRANHIDRHQTFPFSYVDRIWGKPGNNVYSDTSTVRNRHYLGPKPSHDHIHWPGYVLWIGSVNRYVYLFVIGSGRDHLSAMVPIFHWYTDA